MFQPTHLHCRRCGTTRPLRFAALLPGEPSLGTKAECADCCDIAFTLTQTPGVVGQRSFCANCDSFCRPRVEASAFTGNVWVCCGACGAAIATLYGATNKV
jgi:hypothetical protein